MSKECRSISYDAMTAHTAVVFTRYMMLSIENRESRDERSLGELFLCHSKNKPPAMQGEDRSLDISMNSCAKIKVGLQNHK